MTDTPQTSGYEPLPTIPQRLLRDLQDARNEKNEAHARAESYRREVLELHDEGACPDSGRLSLRVDSRQRQTISQAAIVEVLGQEALNRLLEAIEPKTVRTVVVVDPTVDARKESERRYGHRVQQSRK